MVEGLTVESLDDLVCSVSQGRFYGIDGSTCKYILDRPSDPPPSTRTDGVLLFLILLIGLKKQIDNCRR